MLPTFERSQQSFDLDLQDVADPAKGVICQTGLDACMLNSVDRLLFVRRVPIFQELRDDFLVRLASIMDELSFPAEHTIFTQGQEGRSLYIVVSGQVRVHIGDKDLAQLGEGNCFGEMSLFDTEPRSASVTTLSPCNCLVLTQQQLYEAIDETPGIAVNIITLLSRRIRELNQKLNAAAGQAVAERLPDRALTDNFSTPSWSNPVRPSSYDSYESYDGYNGSDSYDGYEGYTSDEHLQGYPDLRSRSR